MQQKRTLWHGSAERSWADPWLWCCHRQTADCPTSQRCHLLELQQKRTLWHESAPRSWAHPWLRCCHHQSLDRPTSQCCHLLELQQKLCMWHGSAGHFWADPWLWCCHRQTADCPTSQRCHLLELQQKRSAWHESAPRLWADPWPHRYRHHSVDCPTSQCCHLPKLQQKSPVWHGSAAHSWADPLLLCCRPQSQNCPMWRHHLQGTTRPSHNRLQLLWAAVLQLLCCLHFEARNLEEVPLDSKVVHPGQQVWGKLAPKTAAPPISDPKRCRPVVAIARHTGHWATTHSVAGCWPVPHNCFLAAPQRPGPHRSSCAFCFRGPWRIWPTQWQETMAHVDVTFLANSLSMFKLALI